MITRNVTPSGRVIIPAPLRKALGISNTCNFELDSDRSQIIITVSPTCKICGVSIEQEQKICEKCKGDLKL